MEWKEWFDDKTQVIFGTFIIALVALGMAVAILIWLPPDPENAKLDLIKGALALTGNIVTGLFGIGIGRAIGRNNNTESN